MNGKPNIADSNGALPEPTDKISAQDWKALTALMRKVFWRGKGKRTKAEVHAEEMRALVVEPNAEQLAESLRFWGIDIDAVGLAASQLKDAVSFCRITISADEMKAQAEMALKFDPNASTQYGHDAQGVLAHHAKFLSAFKARDDRAALGHFAAMHDACARVIDVDLGLHIKRELRDMERLKHLRTISKGPRKDTEKAKFRRLFDEKMADEKLAHLPMRERTGKVKAAICADTRINLRTLNRYLQAAATPLSLGQ
jgi:hypothetical protein